MVRKMNSILEVLDRMILYSMMNNDTTLYEKVLREMLQINFTFLITPIKKDTVFGRIRAYIISHIQ